MFTWKENFMWKYQLWTLASLKRFYKWLSLTASTRAGNQRTASTHQELINRNLQTQDSSIMFKFQLVNHSHASG
jgi:hypothetical protein